MNKDEFIKEALKAKFEFYKIYSVFLIGLISAVVSMVLSDNYNTNKTHVVVFITAIAALVFVIIYFLVLTFEIKNLLKQINK